MQPYNFLVYLSYSFRKRKIQENSVESPPSTSNLHYIRNPCKRWYGLRNLRLMIADEVVNKTNTTCLEYIPRYLPLRGDILYLLFFPYFTFLDSYSRHLPFVCLPFNHLIPESVSSSMSLPFCQL